MKICDLTQAYTANSGGIRTYIEAKKKFIQKQTKHSHVLIIPGDSDKQTHLARSSIYEIKSPLVPNCEPYRFILNLKRVYSILKQEKPDVIELGSGYLLPWIAFLYRFWHKCEVISFYHTDYPTAYVKQFISQYLGNKMGTFAEKLSQQYVRLIYSHCEATITASHLFRKKLEQLKIPNIFYLPLGVDSHIFHPEKRDVEFRRKLGLNSQDILLLFVGRLDYEKRVNVILEAFYQLPQPNLFHLLFVGDGPEKEQLQNKASGNPRIKILAYEKNRKKLAKIFASADIYLTAGPHETFGLSVLEAQASGLPVIGVKAGALLERVPATVGLLGTVDSPREMAQNILNLIQKNFRILGKNARWLTENSHSWEQIFTQLFRFYTQKCPQQTREEKIICLYSASR